MELADVEINVNSESMVVESVEESIKVIIAED